MAGIYQNDEHQYEEPNLAPARMNQLEIMDENLKDKKYPDSHLKCGFKGRILAFKCMF